jgi:type I restriction enzyme M protein
MAKRIAYIIDIKNCRIIADEIEFKWYSGFALIQKQKSILAFHEAIKNKYENLKILEVSSKSGDKLGISLSAFNLKMKNSKTNKEMSVECAFQGSKVFEQGGPFIDLYDVSSKQAKKDERIKKSGKLIKFKFYSYEFPLIPLNFFYDWLYLNTLKQNTDLCSKVLEYDVFTDIEFNHEKSVNCQAKSLALFVLLKKIKLDHLIVKDKFIFESIYNIINDSTNEQSSFF